MKLMKKLAAAFLAIAAISVLSLNFLPDFTSPFSAKEWIEVEAKWALVSVLVVFFIVGITNVLRYVGKNWWLVGLFLLTLPASNVLATDIGLNDTNSVYYFAVCTLLNAIFYWPKEEAPKKKKLRKDILDDDIMFV